MAQIYFLIFWIPAVASAVSLWIAWSAGILRRPILLLAWFGLALFLQLVSYKFSPGWAIGLVLQVVLAVYLGIRRKLDL
jgi:hypothetical protein